MADDVLCCLYLYTTVSLQFIFMASTFFRYTKADEVVIVMGNETARVLVIHEFIRRLNPEIWDREQHGRVSVHIPTNGNPVKCCVQAVICPSLVIKMLTSKKYIVISEEDLIIKQAANY